MILFQSLSFRPFNYYPLCLQDLFFKYTWNNFLHLQVELCVATIMNHFTHPDLQIPGIQNHEDRPAAGAGSPVEEETPGQNNTSDPATTTDQDALVTNVRLRSQIVKNDTILSCCYFSPTVFFLQLFQHCRLVQRILDAWEENDKIQ